MLGSQALEVAVGLVLVFMLVSLVLTAVRETIEAITKTRALDLERAIAELLDDRAGIELRRDFYNHPLIFSLFPGDGHLSAFDAQGRRLKNAGKVVDGSTPDQRSGNRNDASRRHELPSYIPRELFSRAMEDLLGAGAVTGRFKEAYDALLRAGGGDRLVARQGLERWYDAAMDRASGWYKRRSQLIVGTLGVLLALLLNINAVTIGRYLATNEVARAQVLAAAGTVDFASLPDDLGERTRALDAQVRTLGLPVGWDAVQWDRIASRFDRRHPYRSLAEGILLLAGFLIVGFAATLGAPFWFDILGKFMVIRSTVKPTEKSPDERSKDVGTGGAPKPREEDHAELARGRTDAPAEADDGPAPDRKGDDGHVVVYG